MSVVGQVDEWGKGTLWVALLVNTVAFSAPMARAGGHGEGRGAAITPHVETDPLNFFLDGYALSIGVRPKAIPHWRLGASAFALDVPDVLIEIDNNNEGLHLRVDYGVSVFAAYQLDRSGRGFFVGATLGYNALELRDEAAPGQVASSTNLYPGLSVGYRWFPLDGQGLYLMPWLNINRRIELSGETQVAGRRLREPPVAAHPLVYLGYEFWGM